MVSARGMPSRVLSPAGITRSSKNPDASAFTARSCESKARRSWDSRGIFHAFAISSQCSPMLRPVARFFTPGTCSFTSARRIASSRSMRSPTVRACVRRRSQSESPCESAICTRLMLSTPPTSASWCVPPSRPAASKAATMLVEQASTVENAGVAASSPASTRTSRAMLLQPRLEATVPHTMRSGRRAGGELRAHGLRHRDGERHRVEGGEPPVDAREGGAHAGDQPHALAGIDVHDRGSFSRFVIASLRRRPARARTARDPSRTAARAPRGRPSPR